MAAAPPDAITRLTRRGLATILIGLLLPPVAFFAVGMLVTPSPGMDGYVPAFLGGMAGAVAGVVVVGIGVVQVLSARRQKQIAAALSR